MSLQGIYNIERCDSLALGVLGVCDSITNDTLKEGLQDTASLLVDHWSVLVTAKVVSCSEQLTGRNTLDTTSTSETSDSGLGDTLDVVSQDLSVTLGTTLAETLSALAACEDKCKLGEETREARPQRVECDRASMQVQRRGVTYVQSLLKRESWLFD